MQQNNPLNEVNPFLIPLIATIETALNQLFSLDPDTYARLARFKGRIIAFHISDLNQTLYFFPDQQGFQIISHYEGEADTTITGSLLAFAKMAVADDHAKTRAVFKGDIRITGDIALGQHFQSLFKQLDIDWEEHLSRMTGDVVAHSLGNMARSFFGWGQHTVHSLSMDVSEYIQYESRDIASAPEIEHFNKQVDQVRSQVDRAEARVNRLLQHLSSSKDPLKPSFKPKSQKKSIQ